MSVSVSPQARGWGMSVVMIARTFYYGDNKDAAATLTKLRAGYFYPTRHLETYQVRYHSLVVF